MGGTWRRAGMRNARPSGHPLGPFACRVARRHPGATADRRTRRVGNCGGTCRGRGTRAVVERCRLGSRSGIHDGLRGESACISPLGHPSVQLGLPRQRPDQSCEFIEDRGQSKGDFLVLLAYASAMAR